VKGIRSGVAVPSPIVRMLFVPLALLLFGRTTLHAQGQVPGYQPGGWAYFGTIATSNCDAGHPVFYAIRIVSA
jgi:hypothetical protein